MMPQASSIRAEVAGQWVSSTMASYNDAMIRSNASWPLILDNLSWHLKEGSSRCHVVRTERVPLAAAAPGARCPLTSLSRLAGLFLRENPH